MESTRHIDIAFVVAFVVVIAGVLLMAIFGVRVSCNVSTELVGPEHEEVWTLLWEEAPLEDIQEAVRDTGKHPDEIAWMGDSLLAEAVYKGRRDVAVWLLKRGADPDGVFPSGRPLLHAIENDNLDMVKLLLAHGADPNLSVGGDMTLIDVAKMRERDEALQLLLDAGATVEDDTGAAEQQ